MPMSRLQLYYNMFLLNVLIVYMSLSRLSFAFVVLEDLVLISEPGEEEMIKYRF